MLQSGMQESQQGTVKVEVAKKEEFAIFYSLLWPGEWSRDKVTEANVDSLLLPDGLHAACLRGTAAHPPGDRPAAPPSPAHRSPTAVCAMHRLPGEPGLQGGGAPELDVALKMQAHLGRRSGRHQWALRSTQGKASLCRLAGFSECQKCTCLKRCCSPVCNIWGKSAYRTLNPCLGR
eukprot:s198_g8.t1